MGCIDETNDENSETCSKSDNYCISNINWDDGVKSLKIAGETGLVM